MSDKAEEQIVKAVGLDASQSVFCEGSPVAVHSSPYDGFEFIKTPLSNDESPAGDTSSFEYKKLRLECIKLALTACENNLDDDQHVYDTMKRYWRFVRTGD